MEKTSSILAVYLSPDARLHSHKLCTESFQCTLISYDRKTGLCTLVLHHISFSISFLRKKKTTTAPFTNWPANWISLCQKSCRPNRLSGFPAFVIFYPLHNIKHLSWIEDINSLVDYNINRAMHLYMAISQYGKPAYNSCLYKYRCQ